MVCLGVLGFFGEIWGFLRGCGFWLVVEFFFGDGGGGVEFGGLCHIEHSEISTEFKTRFLNLWILRFLAKAQYDNFIDMTKFRRLFEF